MDGEVGQDRHREILFSESLFDHFKRRGSVVGRKADLGDEMDEQEGSDACKPRWVSVRALMSG